MRYINRKKTALTREKGFIALLVSVLLMVIMMSVGLAVTYLMVTQYQVYDNALKSLKVRVAAESGVEDALLRLRKAWAYTVPYGFNLASSSIGVDVQTLSAGSKSIIATASSTGGIIKKIRANFNLTDSTNVSFYYGAQVGEGGLEMEPNARIKGNVYANGSIINNSGTAYIDNNVIVAKNGNRLEGIAIGENATVYSCINSTIGNNLTYVSGGSLNNCTVSGSTTQQAGEIPTEDLPIPQSQVAAWKQVAEDGGIWPNDMVIDDDTTLGPLQIGTPLNPKNLSITGKKILRISGTIFVTGDINICVQCKVELDQAAYGATSGVLLTDGKISVDNNAVLQGSGLPGSYLLLLSNNNSVDIDSPAIYIANNSQGAIFYTTQGMISLRNNMKVHEVTGYKIHIKNGATIEYESGLENSFFSSGTGGSWQVSGWEEVE